MELKVEKPVRKYESIIIMHPDATEADQKALFQKNQEIIKNFGGEVTRVNTWGKRKLANAVGKLRMGTYFHSYFEAKAESIRELERTMRINDKVLRFMHTVLDPRETISKHMDKYGEVLSGSIARDQEREAKAQARRQTAAGGAPRKPKEMRPSK
ncbi:MAG: 30S ribosomal protein S6 [Bdellovibrionales bacterium]|nr:30S ribosomal protein S6 [Bdellovibrionales bacterium]